MSVSTQDRVRAGVSTGGQFATMGRPESDVALAGRELKQTSRGVFEVHDTVTEDFGDGMVRLHVNPQGWRSAPALAAGKRLAARSGRINWDDYVGKQATVLLQRPSGSVEAREGRVVDTEKGVALLSKGKSRYGVYLNDSGGPGVTQVLDVAAGYGQARALADRFDRALAGTPQVLEATFDDLPADVEQPVGDVGAVYAYTHPGFDDSCDGRGSLFFATDVQTDERGNVDIVNGYGLYPEDSGLFSEHGSIEARDLRRWGGRVADYQPGTLTFSDAARLGSVAGQDMGQVYESVLAGQVPESAPAHMGGV